MIADIDKLNLGCKIKDVKPYDILAVLLNEQIKKTREGYIKENEGIRIDLDLVDQMEALKILEKYETKMKTNYYTRKKTSKR